MWRRQQVERRPRTKAEGGGVEFVKGGADTDEKDKEKKWMRIRDQVERGKTFM